MIGTGILLSLCFLGYQMYTSVEYSMESVSGEEWISDRPPEVVRRNNQLVVRVQERAPTPCYELYVSHIAQSGAELTIKTGVNDQGGTCPQVVTTLSKAIVVGTDQFSHEIESITVEGKDGTDRRISEDQFFESRNGNQ